jgi:hypothetical protein
MNVLKKIIKSLGRKLSILPKSESFFFSKYKVNLEKDFIDKGLAISINNEYVYCRLRKCANSTVIATLYNIETGKKITSLDKIQNIKDNYFNNPVSLSKSEVKKLKGYYKFTIVRNPYNRIISAYLDKIKPKNVYQRKIVAAHLSKDENDDISFDEFLSFLEQGGLKKNSHWAPQTDFLVFPISEYDFIGRLENFNSDFEKIIQDIYNIQSIEIVSVTEHKTKSNKNVESISNEQKSRIYELYKEDFTLLGYDKDL